MSTTRTHSARPAARAALAALGVAALVSLSPATAHAEGIQPLDETAGIQPLDTDGIQPLEDTAGIQPLTTGTVALG